MKGPQVAHSGGKPLAASLYPALSAVAEDLMGIQAIEELCKANDFTSKNKKSGQTEYTTFALTFLWRRIIKDKIEEDIKVLLTTQLGNKSKAGSRDVSNATLFNTQIVLDISKEDLDGFTLYCKSEKQLKFWKMLWYKYLAHVRNNFKLNGYAGNISFSNSFYKDAEQSFKDTHPELYGNQTTPLAQEMDL